MATAFVSYSRPPRKQDTIWILVKLCEVEWRIGRVDATLVCVCMWV